MKRFLSLITATVLLTSCLKQSIADAMLNEADAQTITATLSYEINGNPLTLTVKDADRQVAGNRRLVCEKANGYVLGAVIGQADFVFTFFTDSLKAGNYKYTGNYGPSYVTTFEGRPQYVYAATDNMNFNVTSYKDGHISGNFSGQLTPSLQQSNLGNTYGTRGSVVIKNGSFTNVPVVY